jgi:hypothetical protein
MVMGFRAPIFHSEEERGEKKGEKKRGEKGVRFNVRKRTGNLEKN